MNTENKKTKYRQDNTSPEYLIDAEFSRALNEFVGRTPKEQPKYEKHWEQVRANSEFFYSDTISKFPAFDDISKKSLKLTLKDQTELNMEWFTRQGSNRESAIIYFHGGGRIAGDIVAFAPLMSYYVHQTGVPFLLIDFRKPPAVTGDMQIEDAFASLEWLRQNAESLGVNPERIAIMGDSGGGGIAAGVAIKARNSGIKIAGQILIYPMLDYKHPEPDRHIEPHLLISYEDLDSIWKVVLGEKFGRDEVSEIVVPARVQHFNGLAPAFIGVGYFDAFRQEDLLYAENLLTAGVPVEFHIYPGVTHGFELIAPDAQVSKRALSDYIRVIQSV